jgi:hypothetical protein
MTSYLLMKVMYFINQWLIKYMEGYCTEDDDCEYEPNLHACNTSASGTGGIEINTCYPVECRKNSDCDQGEGGVCWIDIDNGSYNRECRYGDDGDDGDTIPWWVWLVIGILVALLVLAIIYGVSVTAKANECKSKLTLMANPVNPPIV